MRAPGREAAALLLTLPWSGFLVVNAHRVTDTCGEAFAVRLLRSGGNAAAFVRAFSDRPGELCRGFSTPEKVLKALLLRHMFLWPRFHMAVTSAFAAHAPEVVEITQPLSTSIRLIQESILEVMLACLDELKRSRYVNTADLTLGAGLFRSFDRMLSRQLDPVWHNVPRRLRQAVHDLRTLRGLSQCLLRYDAVSFLRYLELLRAGESREALWLFADATHTVFEHAKRRVYTLRKAPAGSPAKRRRAADGSVAEAAPPLPSAPAPAVLEPVLEPLPKWGLLRDVVAEIRAEQARLRADAAAAAASDDPAGRAAAEKLLAAAEAPILVVARDGATARQLEQVLHVGTEAVMRDAWELYLQQCTRVARPPAPGAARGRGARGRSGRGSRGRGRSAPSVAPAAAEAQQSGPGRNSRAEAEALAAEATAASRRARAAGAAPAVRGGRGQARRGRGGRGAAAQGDAPPADEEPPAAAAVVDGIAVAALETRDGALYALRPSFLVLYEPCQAFIREIEVYKAERPGVPCRVYLLQHDTSVDEQRFRAATRREQEAFESLIRTREHMAAPEEQEGRAIAAAVVAGEHHALLLTGPPATGSPSALVSTRKAGGRAPASAAVPVVVVDVREFMSPLPCVLHTAGFKLAPLTLEVGDYILSPELCVERKSLPDLVGSLASGRLYHQAEAMCRHYAAPVLLIEFDADKHFGFTTPGELGDDVSSKALGSKLALLLLHFPKLRVLWSRSVHATAHLFAALKANAEQPDAAQAATVGLLTGTDEAHEEPTNSAAIDLLRRLPGVTERNVHAVLRQVGSLSALATSSEARLAEVLGDAHQGATLHRFLHSPFPAFTA